MKLTKEVKWLIIFATISLMIGLVASIVIKKITHFEATNDPTVVVSVYEELYGEGATATEDTDFEATELVVKKEVVEDADGNVVGYAYTATGLSDQEIPGHGQAETVTLLVAIDTTGKVKGVVTLESNHTPGFYAKYNDAIDALKDIDLEDLEIDLDASASISHRLLERLLNAVKEVGGQ